MHKKNVLIKYLGCRLNQFEADYIKSNLKNNGYNEVNKNADICIINTCTVTQHADIKSKKLIKKIRKENPDAFLIATGCMVETNEKDLRKLNAIDLFVNNHDKLNILKKIHPKQYVPNDSLTQYTTARTRPYIKIQDGCNHGCTYCKVRLARGKSRSEPFNKIIKTAEYLAYQDYKEIVLTGINIGNYNDENKNLKDLLIELIRIKDLKQIQLSSIEPTNINDDLIKILKHKKICKYFHIPLQSASDKILHLMKRPYEINLYSEIINKLKNINNDVIIGTDIIVGFPGETDDDFIQTFNFLKNNNIFYLHVFKYSSRENTKASLFKNSVPEIIKHKRSKILLDYEKKFKMKYYQSLINKRINVLIENKFIKNRFVSALSSNYIPVLLPLSIYKDKIGEIQKVKIVKVDEDKIYAQ